jgi:ribonucleotide monophosphatase NagD (HAD superfamily)
MFLVVSNLRSEDEMVWDSTSIETFLGRLKELAVKKKPMLIANPNKFVFIGTSSSYDSKGSTPKSVLRQGAIGEAHVELGGKVQFIGKPYPEVYRYVLNAAVKLRGIPFDRLIAYKLR